MPAAQAAPATECAAVSRSSALIDATKPVSFNASTSTNRPATRGSTPQEMSFTTLHVFAG